MTESPTGGSSRPIEGGSAPTAPGNPRRFFGSVDIDMVCPVKSFDANSQRSRDGAS
jgi:hypothetical protein